MLTDSSFSQYVERKIVTFSLLSFMGPPIGWMIIIFFSKLMSFEGLVKIFTNPFFYLYVSFFLILTYARTKNKIKRIRLLAAKSAHEEINQLIKYTPRDYFLYTAFYGFLGPPSVTLGLGFDNHTFILCWVLGPVVIATFSIPFFNYYISLLEQYCGQIPMSRANFYSFKRRKNTSIIYLVTGIMTTLSIVSYVSFYNLLHGVQMEIQEIAIRITLFCVFGILLLAVPLLFQTRQTSADFVELEKVVNRIAMGKLEQFRLVLQRNEIGLLGQSARELNDFLRKFIRNIKSNASLMNEAGEVFNKLSDELRNHSGEQMNSVNQVYDLVGSIDKHVVANGTQASQIQARSCQITENVSIGQEQVEQLNEAMNLIHAKIKAIDDIAKQTNMLALNASVEAANAGEYGKGFAVVASEVRKLAERSKETADEITSLVEEGAEKAATAKETFNEIAPVVSESDKMLLEFIENIKFLQQETASIHEEMENLKKISQGNSERASKIDQSAKELVTEGEKINEEANYFK